MTDPQVILTSFVAGMMMGFAVRALAIGLLVIRNR